MHKNVFLAVKQVSVKHKKIKYKNSANHKTINFDTDINLLADKLPGGRISASILPIARIISL
jgi:hypothetical protein